MHLKGSSHEPTERREPIHLFILTKRVGGIIFDDREGCVFTRRNASSLGTGMRSPANTIGEVEALGILFILSETQGAI